MQERKVSAAEALCDGGFVEETAIVDAFQSNLSIPRASMEVSPPQLPKPLDRETLKHHLATPVKVTDGKLLLAMVNPLDYEAIRKVRFASGLRAVPAVATLSEIRVALERSRAQGVSPDRMAVQASEDADDPTEIHEALDHPIVKMTSLLIEQGADARASDIHLEPSARELVVRYRIDGMLEEVTRLSKAVRGPLTARLKVMAQLDIAERRRPQDGRITFKLGDRQLDLRVSTLPTQYGEKVVLRLLDPKRSLIDLDQMGFEPSELASVEECLHQSEGMILTTGPTGSGKSTTLYAMLKAIQAPEVNIVTVENPVEYRLPGITQTEINERQGLTFAGALRSILRQDPDVILVGEIRDPETAEIAIQAAQTGHLVLSTLHTNDSVGAVTRLSKLGVDRELIASTLLVVVAQRLVRTTCAKCGERVPASTWDDLPLRKLLGSDDYLQGKGCADCRQTGYRGRLGIYEVFRNKLEAKRLINAGASEVELRDLIRRQGGRTLMEVALEKVRAGHTTLKEVVRVIKPDEGMGFCPACGEGVELRFRTCPFCGATLRKDCPSCQSPLQEGWERCPTCGTPIAAEVTGAVAEQAETTTVALAAAKTNAAPSFLGAAVRGLTRAAGLDEVAAGELELAVVESCNLACSLGDNAGKIHVETELSSDGHSVCISDDGPPWPWPRPSAKVPDLKALAEDETPELHAFLIRSLVDEASYERADRTNRLWLIKRSTSKAD